jgi:hypothetical protein
MGRCHVAGISQVEGTGGAKALRPFLRFGRWDRVLAATPLPRSGFAGRFLTLLLGLSIVPVGTLPRSCYPECPGERV